MHRGSPQWGGMKADNYGEGARLKIAETRASSYYHSQLRITAGGWEVKPVNPFQRRRPGSALGGKTDVDVLVRRLEQMFATVQVESGAFLGLAIAVASQDLPC